MYSHFLSLLWWILHFIHSLHIHILFPSQLSCASVQCSGGGLAAFHEGRPFQSRTAYADAAQPEGESKRKKVVVLGTGWAGVSFLKNLKSSSYDVEVVSPHNYFLFTPLLPSITCGTVEPRSIVEPIRCITKKVYLL